MNPDELQQPAPYDPNTPAPQNGVGPQMPPEIMEMLMQILTAMPQAPAGDMPMGMPQAAVPGMAQGPSQPENEIGMMLQMLQQGQPQAQAMTGPAGFQGGMFGGMGGRPRGS